MPKKGASAWKLLMLTFVGFCGFYICWMGINYKLSAGNLGLKSLNVHVNDLWSSNLGSHPIQHLPKAVKYDRGTCACLPAHNFVILSMQRSGSGWFETLLNSHPNISSHGEIFSVKSRRTKFSAIVSALDAIYNLDWNSSASKNDCISAVGFKWMLNQGVMDYNKEASAYFQKRGVSVIFLFRHNLLKRLVSVLANAYDRDAKLLNGTHKAHVHSEHEAEALASYRPVINTYFLPAHLQRIRDITNDALHFFNNTRHMIIYYEDLVKDHKVLKGVLKFLGVPQMKLGSQHVKIHKKPLREQIENWEEVSYTLKGSKFEEFFTDNDYF